MADLTATTPPATGQRTTTPAVSVQPPSLATLLAPIAKMDAAKQVVTSVVLDPYEDRPDGSVGPLIMGDWLDEEAQDWCSPAGCEAAAYGWLANSREINAGTHFISDTEDGAVPVESYCFPYPSSADYAAAMAGNAHRIYRMPLGSDVVHSGAWVLSARLPDDLWARALAGELGAYSIEGAGERTPVDPATFPAVSVIDLTTPAPPTP